VIEHMRAARWPPPQPGPSMPVAKQLLCRQCRWAAAGLEVRLRESARDLKRATGHDGFSRGHVRSRAHWRSVAVCFPPEMSKLLDRHEAPLPDGWGYRGSTKPPTNSVKPKAFATQTFADAPDPHAREESNRAWPRAAWRAPLERGVHPPRGRPRSSTAPPWVTRVPRSAST